MNASCAGNDTTANSSSSVNSSSCVNNSSYSIDVEVALFKDRRLTDYLLFVLFFLVILTTVIGNTLIIFAVFTTRRLRTVTNYFVMSLAVADWLVGTFVMPIGVVYHIIDKWTFGPLICDIWVSLDVCLCTASILSLCAISIDRYFAITKPLRYSKKRRSKRLASLMILVVWALSLIITFAPLFGWYDETHHKDNLCSYNQNKWYVLFSAMLSFFLPFGVVVFVYFKISRVINERHNRLEALNGPKLKIPRYSRESMERPSVDMDESMRVSSLRRGDECRVSLKRENKTAQTLFIVVGGFIACWLLFFIAYLITPFLAKDTIPQFVMKWLTWLGWINSAINPFIYAFVSQDFRMAFWRLTCSFCAGQKPNPNVANNRFVIRYSHYSRNQV
ncbi:Neuropeptide Y receptor family,G protein-coupled receptor, rhodopsin-like,GPCR, rhodopsin-like, 7TM [Cinara cedri]|uniref:Neuropeptide Y receptor family,G protein-coupled receptor, rhodopsin-like,GPCR, rhodopsin-like, 7TM n=1 Tax=Cinara cedri TaxID=506608 RepID=A0A5E4MRX7_9HEMI|nr:Neuropeptide Y receptor family,G protein-coupled receptor, rhodopsin-like,GPCR, rhodopsin-like, 7TM [Cinara cedri]